MFTKFQLFLERTETFDSSFIEELSKFNLATKIDSVENYIYKDGVLVCDLRYHISNNYVEIDMIYVYEAFQRQNIGTAIYVALLNAARRNNLKGIYSPCFSNSNDQQRSPAATNLLKKLINKFGGNIVNLDINVDKQDFIDNDIPYYGPPFEDLYLTGAKYNNYKYHFAG